MLLQMWVGWQRPRRQEFQMLSAPILGGYVQVTTYVLITSGQPKGRDIAATHRNNSSSLAIFAAILRACVVPLKDLITQPLLRHL